MAWLPASSRTVAPARSAIIRWGDQTIGGIAVRLDLEPSTITPLVKRLEQAGHVLRQRNPADERQGQVSLTDKGRALRAETKTLAEALYGKSRMSVAEVADLNVRVTALRDAFKAAEPVASRVGPP